MGVPIGLGSESKSLQTVFRKKKVFFINMGGEYQLDLELEYAPNSEIWASIFWFICVQLEKSGSTFVSTELVYVWDSCGSCGTVMRPCLGVLLSKGFLPKKIISLKSAVWLILVWLKLVKAGQSWFQKIHMSKKQIHSSPLYRRDKI